MRSLILFLVFQTSLLHGQVWQQLPDFPGTPRDDAALFSLNEKIYVGTGLGTGWALTNDWWCYDTQSEVWSSIASLPGSPRQYCSGFTVSDTGYVFGGLDAAGALNELWAYHPSSDQWVQKASLPAEARYACAAVEGFQYGIVATGMLSSGVPTNEAWKYHPATDEWETMNPVPGPARHRATAFQDDGGMLIIGGADGDFGPLSDAWSYPVWFETGTYYERNDLPGPRYGARGGSNLVQVIATGASDMDTFHDDVWYLTGSSWNALPSFPGGLRRGGVGAGISSQQFWMNSFFFGLGLDNALARRNDWWRLDVTLSVDEAVMDRLGIYPAPATSSFHVMLPPEWINARITITDALGRIVHELRWQASVPIGTEALAPGRYEVMAQHGVKRLRSALVIME